MVEAFGGKVTGAVSGRTHILVVGKEPGLGKVSQAERQPSCQLMVRFCVCVCFFSAKLS
jgi:NAD-dependent DNA ligase